MIYDPLGSFEVLCSKAGMNPIDAVGSTNFVMGLFGINSSTKGAFRNAMEESDCIARGVAELENDIHIKECLAHEILHLKDLSNIGYALCENPDLTALEVFEDILGDRYAECCLIKSEYD